MSNITDLANDIRYTADEMKKTYSESGSLETSLHFAAGKLSGYSEALTQYAEIRSLNEKVQDLSSELTKTAESLKRYANQLG